MVTVRSVNTFAPDSAVPRSRPRSAGSDEVHDGRREPHADRRDGIPTGRRDLGRRARRGDPSPRRDRPRPRLGGRLRDVGRLREVTPARRVVAGGRRHDADHPGAAVLLVPTLLGLRGRWGLLRRNAWLVVGYGVTGVAGCQLAYFFAVSHLSVGVALLLEYLAPVLIVGWLWARHRRRPGRLTLLGVALALAGLLLVLDLTGEVSLSPVGVLWGLGAAVCLVLYFLLADQVDEGLSPITLAGAGLVVGAAVLWLAAGVGVLDMTRGADDVLLGGREVAWWVPVLVLAVVAAAFAYVTGVGAVRVLGSKVASFVALTEVLFAVLFAWLLLGELPVVVQLVGGALIVGGVVAVRADEPAGRPVA